MTKKKLLKINFITENWNAGQEMGIDDFSRSCVVSMTDLIFTVGGILHAQDETACSALLLQFPLNLHINPENRPELVGINASRNVYRVSLLY